MDLILWRHADAHSTDRETDLDLHRPLTGKGRRQAEQMADWLDRHLADTVKVLSSPAVRAVETAEALGRKVSVREELAPGSTASAILGAANWPESRHQVVIVGHQPALGQIASLLLFGDELPTSIRKASVWWIGRRNSEDLPRPVLRACLGPDLL